MIDRKECEHLIGAVAVDLADTTPDPKLPTEWCDGWDAAVAEHAEPLAEQLRMALAEIDRLEAERSQAVTERLGAIADADQLRRRCEGLERMLGTERDATALRARIRTQRSRYEAQREADTDEVAAVHETMRAEIEALRCGDLGPYFDGELSTERHDAFDLHLTTCEQCAAGLLGLMQQDAVVSQGFERRAAVLDAAVAWVRAGGTLAALTAAVNALEDGNG